MFRERRVCLSTLLRPPANGSYNKLSDGTVPYPGMPLRSQHMIATTFPKPALFVAVLLPTVWAVRQLHRRRGAAVQYYGVVGGRGYWRSPFGTCRVTSGKPYPT